MIPLNIGEITDRIVVAVQNAGIKQETSAMLMAQIALLKNQALTDRSAYQKQNIELDACKLANRDLQLQLADLKEKMRKLNEPLITRQARRILKFLASTRSDPLSTDVASSIGLEYDVFMLHFGRLKKRKFVCTRCTFGIAPVAENREYIWITQNGREALDKYEEVNTR